MPDGIAARMCRIGCGEPCFETRFQSYTAAIFGFIHDPRPVRTTPFRCVGRLVVQSRSVMACIFAIISGGIYGTTTTRKRYDYLRHPSSNTAIAGFDLGVEQEIRDQSEDGGQMARPGERR